MDSISKYRLYCNTESSVVYTWDSKIPALCPNNSSHTIDSDSIVIVDSISNKALKINNFQKSSFDEIEVAIKTKVIDIKPSFGLSNIRDIYTGTVTNDSDGSQTIISVTNAYDISSVITREHGRYSSGNGAECGIGLLLPFDLVNDQTLKWGLFDSVNGFYFKKTLDNFYVCLMSNGVETAVAQSSFNRDSSDGSGSSGSTLNLSKGNIFRITYSWYGYGSINFSYQSYDSRFQVNMVYLHTFIPNGHVSIKKPNLQIAVELDNNTNTTAAECYVSGRQYSILGEYIPKYRSIPILLEDVNIDSLSYINILNLQKSINGIGSGSYIDNIKVYSTTDQVVQLWFNTTLTASSFGGIPDTESLFLMDTSSTAYANGHIIWSSLIPANTHMEYNLKNLPNITNNEILSFVVKAKTVTTGNINMIVTLSEEW